MTSATSISFLLLFFSVFGIASGNPILSLTQIIAPINNSAIDAEPSWVRDPDGRGTVGLMLSCVLTLGLCVWTGYYRPFS